MGYPATRPITGLPDRVDHPCGDHHLAAALMDLAAVTAPCVVEFDFAPGGAVAAGERAGSKTSYCALAFGLSDGSVILIQGS